MTEERGDSELSHKWEWHTVESEALRDFVPLRPLCGRPTHRGAAVDAGFHLQNMQPSTVFPQIPESKKKGTLENTSARPSMKHVVLGAPTGPN